MTARPSPKMGSNDEEGRLLYGLAVEGPLSFKVPTLVLTHVLPEREDGECPVPTTLGRIKERILLEHARRRIAGLQKSKSLTNLFDKN